MRNQAKHDILCARCLKEAAVRREDRAYQREVDERQMENAHIVNQNNPKTLNHILP